MSETGRRGFFGTLLGGAAASELLANVPEPEKVERIDPPALGQKTVFVMSVPSYLEQQQYENIKEAWRLAFAPSEAPQLLILEEGLKLQQIIVNENVLFSSATGGSEPSRKV